MKKAMAVATNVPNSIAGWVVSDAFFTVAANARGVAGLFLRLTKTTPGLCIGRTFTWLAVRDRAAYRQWLDAQLDRDRPTRLITGHGEVLTDTADTTGAPGESTRPLVDRLRAVIEERL